MTVRLTLVSLPLMLQLSCSSYEAEKTVITYQQMDQFITRADSLLRIGNADSAGLLFAFVSSAQPANLRTLLGLGKSALAVRDWDRAVECGEKVCDIDPGSLAGRYIEAVARTEKGAFAFREPGSHGPSFAGDWGRARRLFTWVLGRDSSFEDVLYQFALLNRYEGNKEGALNLVARQEALRPDLVGPRIGEYRVYEYWIATEDSANIINWLRTLPGSLPRYYEGEVCRRHRNLVRADSIFEGLLTDPGEVSLQAVRLSLARLSMQQGNEVAAELEYWKAVGELSDPLGSEVLFEDLKYIVSDKELYLFKGLDSVKQQRDFFRSFWNFRNPSFALKFNPRLREHIKRYVAAEHRYEFYGARTRFNNPDRLNQLKFPAAFSLNDKFNDMGLIYLRHGAPDDIVRHENTQEISAMDMEDDPRIGTLKNSSIREKIELLKEIRQRYKDAQFYLGAINDSFESWLYDATAESPRMIFHFQMHQAVGNNWRLTPLPDNDPMLGELAGWDPKYSRMYWGHELDRVPLQTQITAESRELVNHALSTENESREKKVETFRFPHAVDVFRAPGGKCLMDVSYAIPLASISRSLPDTLQTVPVEIGFSLVDARSEHAASQVDTVNVDIFHSRKGMILDLIRYTVPPDSYAVAMHLRPLVGEKLATWKQTIRAANFARAGFMISSIQLLRPSGDQTGLDIDGVKVVQSPLLTYVRTEKLLVYFQMYHLVADADGVTSCRTECILQPFDDPDPAKEILVYTKDKTGTDEMAAQFCQIDVHYVPAGRYRLIVKATDRKRVETCVAERELQLLKP